MFGSTDGREVIMNFFHQFWRRNTDSWDSSKDRQIGRPTKYRVSIF